ncbi:aldehyde dehydrogenase [Staphylococcus saccharolyticus]|uniref:Aldehyde dehydrogenase n=1 Tax=Staphylococcus saccharolyticus TaxID=33028 RepID=A0A380H126_9STAP|nr:aldehyde dehydrogenase [Staphylococcus saccharolyticus]
MTVIESKFNNSKGFFNSHITKNLKFRKQQLKYLSKSIKNHESELLTTLDKDLGKSKVEAYVIEIGMLLKNIKFTRKELKNWAKTKQVDTSLYLLPTKSYIKKEPYGYCTYYWTI